MQSCYFTTSDGVQLHFLAAGQGPQVVLIPGFCMPAEIWIDQIRLLSAHYRVIAFDPRCHGRSSCAVTDLSAVRLAADLHELLQHLGGPATLVAWAFAGRQALAYLTEFGESQLTGLVLVDGFVCQEDSRETVMGAIEDWQHQQRSPALAVQEFVQSLFVQPVAPAVVTELMAAVERVPVFHRLALAAAFLTRLDQLPALPSDRVPLLYIGTDAKQEQAALVEAWAPHARVTQIANAGHAVFIDQPLAFHYCLSDFLRDHVGPRLLA